MAPELHAELYYKKLIKEIPSLRLVVLLRDPREALAAVLYWKTFPNRIKNSDCVIIHKLFLWCLAAEVGRHHAKTMPDLVSVVYLDDVNNIQSSIFGKFLKHKTDIDKKIILKQNSLYFSYDSLHGFLGPNGEYSHLLSAGELYMIETITKSWYTYPDSSHKGYKATHIVRLNTLLVRGLLRVVILIAYIDPVAAKGFVDFLFSPTEQIYKLINSIKLKIKNSMPRLYLIIANARVSRMK